MEVGGFNLFTDLFLNPQTPSTSYKPPMNIHKPIPKPIDDGEYLAWSSQVRKLLRRPRGMVWGGRREEGSGWGTHVYLWQIHFDIWQNEYNIVKSNKIKLKKKESC